MAVQTGDHLLTPQELVTRWHNIVSTRTLANWRSQATGPKYIKIGGRIVYPVEVVEEWERKRTVGGTADYCRG